MGAEACKWQDMLKLKKDNGLELTTMEPFSVFGWLLTESLRAEVGSITDKLVGSGPGLAKRKKAEAGASPSSSSKNESQHRRRSR